MELEIPKPPFENQTVVKDKRTNELFTITAGFGAADGSWSFLCWPHKDGATQEDCKTIEEEHLTDKIPINNE